MALLKLACLLASFGIAFLCTPVVCAQVFKVGFAKRDITPTTSVPLWGYGKENRPDMMSTGVLDNLLTKCVVIDVGTGKLAIVGLDLGRSPTTTSCAAIRTTVKERSGIDYVLLVGSHTHHGPVVELRDLPGEGQGAYDAAVAYSAELQRKLIEVISEAAGSVQGARIGWGKTECHLNRNRHSSIPPVPTDPDLVVLRFDDLDGKPIALLVNYAAHPTVRPPQDGRFSAEYPGVMMREVEQALGTNCVFLQGAAGDLQCEMNDDLWGKDDFIEPIGKALAQEVLNVNRTIHTAVPLNPSLQGKDEDFSFDTRIDLLNPEVQAAFAESYFPEIVKALVDETIDGNGQMHPHLTSVLLNKEIFFVGVSGEFFCNHANRLKARARVPLTVFAGYCNGHHMYFPTLEAAAEGGYGADPASSWVELGAPEQMMDRAVQNLYEMLGKF